MHHQDTEAHTHGERQKAGPEMGQRKERSHEVPTKVWDRSLRADFVSFVGNNGGWPATRWRLGPEISSLWLVELAEKKSVKVRKRLA